MAGGPLWPFAKFPVTEGICYPLLYVGGGGVADTEEGMGLLALHGSDGLWELRFAMPPILPTGTAKLRLVAMADAAVGDEDVEPSWASVAMGESPSAATLTGEGDTNFLWGVGDEDDYKEGVIVLDADTVVADEFIVMRLTFKAATSSLNAESVWQAYIFWE